MVKVDGSDLRQSQPGVGAEHEHETGTVVGSSEGAAEDRLEPRPVPELELGGDRAELVGGHPGRRELVLHGDLAALESKIAGAPGVAAEQGQIDREYQVLKDQYDKAEA